MPRANPPAWSHPQSSLQEGLKEREGVLKVVLWFAAVATGVAILVSEGDDLRLNSPILVFGIICLGVPAAVLVLATAKVIAQLLSKTEDALQKGQEAVAETVTQWKEQRSEVRELRQRYRGLKAHRTSVIKRDVLALHACRNLPLDLRRDILDRVRGPPKLHRAAMLELSSELRASRQALEAAKRSALRMAAAQGAATEGKEANVAILEEGSGAAGVGVEAAGAVATRSVERLPV